MEKLHIDISLWLPYKIPVIQVSLAEGSGDDFRMQFVSNGTAFNLLRCA